MLDFAVLLTHRPAGTTRADIEALRDVGFDDRAIAQIVQITGLFNYYNRIVDGLGAEHEPEWEGHPPRSRA